MKVPATCQASNCRAMNSALLNAATGILCTPPDPSQPKMCNSALCCAEPHSNLPSSAKISQAYPPLTLRFTHYRLAFFVADLIQSP